MYHRMLSAAFLCAVATVSAPGAGGFVQTGTAGGARAEGRSGMVSSAHPLATEAGLEILRAGGTAYEAAVAVAAALNVVEPAMSGLGGYGTILTWDARDQRVRFLNASGRIPIATNADLFPAPTPEFEKNRTGAKAVSTPGNLHAWEALAGKRSRLKWADLLTPAIRLAGGPVTELPQPVPQCGHGSARHLHLVRSLGRGTGHAADPRPARARRAHSHSRRRLRVHPASGPYGRAEPGTTGCDPQLSWDGTAPDGTPVTAGVYLAKLGTPEGTFFKRIVYLGPP